MKTLIATPDPEPEPDPQVTSYIHNGTSSLTNHMGWDAWFNPDGTFTWIQHYSRATGSNSGSVRPV